MLGLYLRKSAKSADEIMLRLIFDGLHPGNLAH